MVNKNLFNNYKITKYCKLMLMVVIVISGLIEYITFCLVFDSRCNYKKHRAIKEEWYAQQYISTPHMRLILQQNNTCTHLKYKKVQIRSKGEISGLGTKYLYIHYVPTIYLSSPFDLG